MQARNGASNEADMASGLVLLGRVTGAQGLKGEVRINSFTSVPEAIASYGPLSDDKGRSFIIEQVRPLKGGAVVARIEGVADRNAAEALKGTGLFVVRAMLPEPEDDEWYYEDLVGLKALSPDGAEIGEIVAVQNFGGGDLLEIKPADGTGTLMVPFTKAAVPVVDVKGRRVIVELVEDEDEQP
jgi:16S rRNA processing protein RimM